MSTQRDTTAAFFSQLDVTTGAHPQPMLAEPESEADLLREVLNAQDRTNDLLENLLSTVVGMHKQRSRELHHWRKANPDLAEACHEAAEALSRVQVEFLTRMTDEINDTREDLVDSEFMLNEFIDRHGPRLAHLNGIIQVLGQLGSTADANAADD